jgi:hypothetical protein
MHPIKGLTIAVCSLLVVLTQAGPTSSNRVRMLAQSDSPDYVVSEQIAITVYTE